MKKLKNIKNSLIQRNSSLLKYALRGGVGFLQKKEPTKLLEKMIGKDLDAFINELSQYKGALTKAGQLISQYGEYYLPKEVNNSLSKLQNRSHYLPFDQISHLLHIKAHADFEFEISPIAAASIGQVHLATPKDESSQKVIFKIQYVGIDKAIKGDLFFVKALTKTLNIFPKGVDISDIFDEIKALLEREMNYEIEAQTIIKYKKLLNDPFFHVPEVYEQYSNDKSICMEYIQGIHLNELHIENFSSDKINRLGEKLFELFLREVFEFSLVQTDAHGGNYLVDKELNRLSLIDFGACLEFPDEVMQLYTNFIRFSTLQDRQSFFETLTAFINYSGKELKYDEDIMWNYVLLLSSPMRESNYNWATSDLPDRLIIEGKKLQKSLHFTSVPAHFIFLDRKILGLFTLLRKLGAQFNVSKSIKPFL